MDCIYFEAFTSFVVIVIVVFIKNVNVCKYYAEMQNYHTVDNMP